MFLSWHTCYVVRGRALGIHQGGATYVTELWCCMCRRGPRRNNSTYSALCWLSITSSATHKQTGPFCADSQVCGFCVLSRTLWVPPRNSPVRLGVSPGVASIPTGIFNQRFEALFPGAGALGWVVCFAPPPFLPVYPCANVGPSAPPATTLPVLVLQQLPC